ncbi:MAG: hypothetical protein Q8P60_14820 [Pseudorhodobacter sp.]|nr:hypothetical protein [Pseudorhodobacter sp.]
MAFVRIGLHIVKHVGIGQAADVFPSAAKARLGLLAAALRTGFEQMQNLRLWLAA